MNRLTLGVLRVGDTELAFEADALREVIRTDTPLAPLPLAPAWSLGSLLVRGQPLPAIDLGRLLALPASAADADPDTEVDLMAILQHRGRRVAMRVSAVTDVLSVDPAQMHDLDSGHHRHALIPQTVTHESLDRPAYRLDLEALFALDGMATVHDVPSAPPEAPRAATETTETTKTTEPATDASWLQIECEQLPLAVATEAVQEVARCGVITPPSLTVPGYLGEVSLHAATLPLFDPRVLIGLPARREPPSHLVVITGNRGRVALAVDRVVALGASADGQRQPLAPGAPYTELVVGTLGTRGNGAETLILAADRLLGLTDVDALARLHQSLNTQPAARRQRERQRFAFVHFDCGTPYTTRLETLAGVETAPRERASTADETFLGTWRWHGQSVSLVDLGRLLGHSPAGDDAQLLIADSGQGLVGFLVAAARGIEYIEAPVESHVTRWRGDAKPGVGAIEAAKQLVAIGEGAERRLLSLICLRTLARHLQAAAANRTRAGLTAAEWATAGRQRQALAPPASPASAASPTSAPSPASVPSPASAAYLGG